MIKKDNLYALLAFTISFLMLFYFYHESLLNLNEYIFANGGDGIKNYYTYLYHAQFDDSFFDFSGMNYPYHENIIFTDAHPLLSYVVGKLGLADYGIGILNFLMLVSYPISTVFIYKIFKHFKVNMLWSVLFGVAITFMAPQVFRMGGHFSLSYVFAIPVMWYLLLKVQNNFGVKWLLISTLYMIAFFFTHPYLGLILAVFVLSYWAVFYLINRKETGSLKQVFLAVGTQVAFPILFFQVMVMLFDTHEGRLSAPAGFFDLHATWSSILIAHHGPILAIKPIFGWTSGNWESWSYIGLTSISFFLIICGFVIKNFKTISFKAVLTKPLALFLMASCLVLVFAMCIPFKYNAFRWIPNVLGPLKQFRVLGRFGWVFFYVFSISMVVLVYKIQAKYKNSFISYGLLSIGLILFFVEFKPTHELVSGQITQAKNPFNLENTTDDFKDLVSHTNQSDYDAIIFLPFTHMSSENVYILGTENSGYDALLLSYHTNTPLLNTISSRTALHEAISMINLFSPDFIEKDLARIIGSDKKILLVTNSDEKDENELRMIKASDKLYSNQTFSTYDFSFDNWNNTSAFNKVNNDYENAKYQYNKGWEKRNLSNRHDELWLSNDSTTWFYHDSFENTTEEHAMSGNGAFAQQKIGWNKLIELNSDILEDGGYTLNFWYNIKIGRPDVLAVAEKVNTDTTQWVDQFMVRETNLVVNDWAYVELNFNYKSTDKINILLTSGPSNDWMVVDELLIRKQGGANLYRQCYMTYEAPRTQLIYKRPPSRNCLVYNNYWIEKNSFE